MNLPARIAMESVVCVAAFLAGSSAMPSGDLALKIIPGGEAPYVWARPYVAPVMEFRQTAGKPAKDFVEGCKVVPMERDHPDHVDRVVTLRCAKGVALELRNVDFSN